MGSWVKYKTEQVYPYTEENIYYYFVDIETGKKRCVNNKGEVGIWLEADQEWSLNESDSSQERPKK